MIPAVGLGDITIGVRQIPLPARIAGVVPRRGLGIQAKLRHQPRPHVVIVKVAANAKMRDTDLVRSEYLARTPNGVVLGMIEIVGVVDVSPDFRRKEL